jgi:hypothetical protein
MSKVSSCCGASGFEFEDYGICPDCKEHCDFEEEEDDDIENVADRGRD